MGKKEFIRAEFIISGHVQGVGFRYFVYSHANALGLKGFSQNMYNGDVRTVAEGDKRSIEELRGFLQSGPTRSYVERVDAVYSDYTGEFRDFGIR